MIYFIVIINQALHPHGINLEHGFIKILSFLKYKLIKLGKKRL
jgi:hypothetical protein